MEYFLKKAGLVKWYNSGLQNRGRGFDSLIPCIHEGIERVGMSPRMSMDANK